MDSPERYAILVKYSPDDDWAPVWNFYFGFLPGWRKMPFGGCFTWNKAVKVRDHLRDTDYFNQIQYTIMPVIADPI